MLVRSSLHTYVMYVGVCALMERVAVDRGSGPAGLMQGMGKRKTRVRCFLLGPALAKGQDGARVPLSWHMRLFCAAC